MLKFANGKWVVTNEPAEDMTLLELIRSNNIDIIAPCNGHGTCKKCAVIIDSKEVLSCETKATKGLSFEIPKGAEVLEESIEKDSIFGKMLTADGDRDTYGVAVDIGTTTVVAYLYKLDTGRRLAVEACMNPQKAFGADVISRIDYTSQGEEERKLMHDTIVKCIADMTMRLLEKGTKNNDESVLATPGFLLKKTVITGNTTMLHFFADWDARGIAVAPFKAYTYASVHMTGVEAGLPKTQEVIVLPSVSAYIGGDIVCGIVACGLDKTQKSIMLIDIGTNGEMALCTDGKIFACSTAAGPAFEGANIKYGMPGLEGAINKVAMNKEKNTFDCTIIGNGAVKGICGSGLLDAMACLLNTGIVDETGRIVDDDELEPEYEGFAGRIKEGEIGNEAEICSGEGDISLIQKDVREVQNAKAAICAGIKVLCKNAGIELSEVDTVYLSGGFGTKLNPESAIRIGLLPAEFNRKIIPAGNSAGEGAIRVMLSKKQLEEACEVAEQVKYIELSNDPLFVDEYVEQMMFE